MRCVMMVLLMGLLIHVLLMADAHVIAHGEWMFGFFEDFFLRQFDSFPTSVQLSSERFRGECERHQK
jgi:hypothetical protein